MPPSDLEIVSALYSSIAEGRGIEPALELLARRFNCASALLVSFEAAVPNADVASAVGTFGEPKNLRTYHKDWSTRDPGPRAFSALRSGAASSTAVMFGPEFDRSNQFYNEFFRAIGLCETLGGNLSSRDGHVAIIGVIAGEKERRPFKPHEIAAFEMLMPHLARALQLRRTFAALGTKLAWLAHVIDRLLMGVIILGQEDSDIHVNRAAREIAARKDGFSLDRKGVPHCGNREAERALVKLCADVCSGGAGGIVRVPRRDAAPPYAVLVAPLPDHAPLGVARSQPPHAPNLLILVHDPDAHTLSTAETIAAIFGLPTATARLVGALVEGEEARLYAERHRIRPDTVKFHLKTAFAKTGLRSQARLLQTVARAIAELGERRRR
jgi:hypothetical protein